MPEKLSTRVGQLEEAEKRAWNAIERLADKQTELDGVMETLAEAQIKTEERFRTIAAENKERDSAADARIERLVSAIGELIRRTPNGSTK
jgi:predicted  nucleic acid-binding Zn-ribbon protein